MNFLFQTHIYLTFLLGFPEHLFSLKPGSESDIASIELVSERRRFGCDLHQNDCSDKRLVCYTRLINFFLYKLFINNYSLILFLYNLDECHKEIIMWDLPWTARNYLQKTIVTVNQMLGIAPITYEFNFLFKKRKFCIICIVIKFLGSWRGYSNDLWNWQTLWPAKINNRNYRENIHCKNRKQHIVRECDQQPFKYHFEILLWSTKLSNA